MYVQDIATSQNHLIKLAKEVQPQKEWTTEYADLLEVYKEAHKAFLRKDFANMTGSVRTRDLPCSFDFAANK